jgi:hypothetical protein
MQSPEPTEGVRFTGTLLSETHWVACIAEPMPRIEIEAAYPMWLLPTTVTLVDAVPGMLVQTALLAAEAS